MGVFDLFGGKTIATHTAVGFTGVMLGRISNRNKINENKNQIKVLEKELEAIKKDKGTKQGRELARITVLKQLAWRDEVLHDKERIYVYKYIMTCVDISSDLMISAMFELDEKPFMDNGFWRLFEMNYKNKLCSNDDEVKGFREVLIQLANIDGECTSSEKKYLNNILKSCGLQAY